MKYADSYRDCINHEEEAADRREFAEAEYCMRALGDIEWVFQALSDATMDLTTSGLLWLIADEIADKSSDRSAVGQIIFNRLAVVAIKEFNRSSP